MLDITKMLHAVIDLEYDIDDAKELLIGPTARRQTIIVWLDVQLAAFADDAAWAKVLSKAPTNQAGMKDHYLKCVALMLLYSAKRQWTQLVVMDDPTWQRIITADQSTKLADLNKEYLAIKHFLSGAYYSHRQEDFRHAWHLLLKMGIVDFKIQPKELETGYLQLIKDLHAQFAE
ncbi:hypothetical protein [Limosilactobacillus sp.]|uniref:hypothetical protein n=1 Tax=Limosilactobacillus sp. TaxID=2773925 RepID=UPI00359F647D